ncbi:MAG: hypothetical protein R2839_06935 [Thermomicrobiales bacterium]
MQAFYAVGINKAQDTLEFPWPNPIKVVPAIQPAPYALRVLAPVALVASDRGLATALVTVLTARQGDPHAAAASAALALFAVVLAVIVHELGHAFMARRVGPSRPAQWTPGLVLAFVLLPTPLGVSPFPGSG